MDIYFSDYFKVSPDTIDKYGAFNVSLVADLPSSSIRFCFSTAGSRNTEHCMIESSPTSVSSGTKLRIETSTPDC
jgi:hypothetical protein